MLNWWAIEKRRLKYRLYMRHTTGQEWHIVQERTDCGCRAYCGHWYENTASVRSTNGRKCLPRCHECETVLYTYFEYEPGIMG